VLRLRRRDGHGNLLARVLQTGAMRTRLERSYRFEAAHFLPKVPPGHKCARMHGHSYLVEIAVEGEVDPERGWLIDFAEIDEHAIPLVRQLDHQVLNEIEGLTNPTSELLAVWIWNHLRPTLPSLTEVVVSETPSSRCIYRG
jgi:6-pyruvoyltetrahydropterin/6-carboxytetrahydropterin synthase